MAQERRTEAPVKVRVVAEKFKEVENDTGQFRIVPAPWTGNTVRQNKTTYGPGDVFEVSPLVDAETGKIVKTAKEVALDLIATGSVQWAAEKPTPFKPPSLDHKINPSHGVELRVSVEGKHPTREIGGPVESKYEEDDYDEGF